MFISLTYLQTYRTLIPPISGSGMNVVMPVLANIMTGVITVWPHRNINDNVDLRWIFFATLTAAIEVSVRFFTFTAVFLVRPTFGILALCYSLQAAILVYNKKNLEVAGFTVITSFISPLIQLKDPEITDKSNSKTKYQRTFFCMNKIATGIIMIVFILLTMCSLHHSAEDEYIEYRSTFSNQTNNLTQNNLLTKKNSVFEWLFPILLSLAAISVLDGIVTMRYKKSPTSSILFPNKDENVQGKKCSSENTEQPATKLSQLESESNTSNITKHDSYGAETTEAAVEMENSGSMMPSKIESVEKVFYGDNNKR